MKNSIVLILIIGTLIITGCATLQYPPPPTPEVQSLPPATFGTLADVSAKFAALHSPDQSGFLLLTPNDDAFRWRLALIDHANQSVDAQYFIWQNDETGALLFDRLLKILIESMGANNLTAAHSHYKKYRRPILATGDGQCKMERFSIFDGVPNGMRNAWPSWRWRRDA